ncbi:IS110 family transposase [Alkalilimnicola ehrlichii]|nr:IS110 family transposase [Alkalilimnicola ehrlichii]
MEVKLIGIDLAKSVFQLCAVNQAGQVVFNRAVKRDRLLAVLRQHPAVPLVMEACYSAHHWGRTFQALGHPVRLIPPQHVKPFVRVNKNDAGDALAICEAAQRPGLHCVPVKSVAQQDLQLLHRLRQRSVRQRTQLANQMRGLAAEYGVVFPKQLNPLGRWVVQPKARRGHNNRTTYPGFCGYR